MNEKTEVNCIILDVEQNDPVRIKEERDTLLKAIFVMGVKVGVLDPSVPVPAPMLLALLEETAQESIKRKLQEATSTLMSFTPARLLALKHDEGFSKEKLAETRDNQIAKAEKAIQLLEKHDSITTEWMKNLVNVTKPKLIELKQAFGLDGNSD